MKLIFGSLIQQAELLGCQLQVNEIVQELVRELELCMSQIRDLRNLYTHNFSITDGQEF